MRILIEQECAAVAGGTELGCEYQVTAALIIGGAAVGGMATGGAGALVGAGAGSLAAQVIAPPLCEWAEGQEQEDPEIPVDPELQDWFDNQYAAWNQGGGFWGSNGEISAPHEFTADGASY